MIVFLAGPIEYWWDSEWDTPMHWRFVDWRNELSKQLVARGHLVYRPHEAFKGAWEPNGGAQAANNRVLELADLVIASNYDPPVRCHGTDDEISYVLDARHRFRFWKRRCHARVVEPIVPRDLNVAERVAAVLDRLEVCEFLDRPIAHPEYVAETTPDVAPASKPELARLDQSWGGSLRTRD